MFAPFRKCQSELQDHKLPIHSDVLSQHESLRNHPKMWHDFESFQLILCPILVAPVRKLHRAQALQRPVFLH